MNKELYSRLGTRLNENPAKLPLIDSVLNFLQSIFTEEEAALGADLPIGAHTCESLARELGRDEKKLFSLLENMADQGLIFVAMNDRHVKEYSLSPFAPGLIEFQSMRGTETEEDIRKAGLLKIMMEDLNELGKDLFKNPELANKIIPAGVRTLTVERELPDNTTIKSYEQVSAILAKENSFAVGYCHCRHQKKLTGGSCEIKDAPERACMYFGKAADYMVERGFTVRVTREECMSILKDCEKAGLVHNLGDLYGTTLVLCNCCGCCCEFLNKMKDFRGLRTVEFSNFVATADADNCTGCGECLSRCSVKALSLENDIILVNADYCIGCGNCVSACPSGCLSMMRKSDDPPKRLKVNLVGLGV